MATIRATYSTTTITPTVYYTALNQDGTTLTARTVTGVTQSAWSTSDYYYDQTTTAAFVARWDEGDATDYRDEFIPLGVTGATGPAGATGPPGAQGPTGPGITGGYIPVILSGPEGSPNGTLAMPVQTVVITPSGEVHVKATGGQTNEGWVQTA